MILFIYFLIFDRIEFHLNQNKAFVLAQPDSQCHFPHTGRNEINEKRKTTTEITCYQAFLVYFEYSGERDGEMLTMALRSPLLLNNTKNKN